MLSNTFAGCSNLEAIYIASNWNASAIYDVDEKTGEKRGSGNSFMQCEKLKGGNGTVYSEEHVDSTYACIDSTATPGYFTAATLSKASVSLAKTSYTYTGNALKPAVTVEWNGAKLASGNYKVAYSSNTNAGTAGVAVPGKGDYSGTAKATFKIVKAANKLTASGKSVKLSKSKVKKKAQSIPASKAYSVSRANGCIW